LSLRGSADASEGISLDELKLVVGQAQLSAKGLLGGQQQDAAFSLTDFPAVLLQPLFSALPALQVGLELCCLVGRLWRTPMLVSAANLCAHACVLQDLGGSATH
jgi:hypothetical protein